MRVEVYRMAALKFDKKSTAKVASGVINTLRTGVASLMAPLVGLVNQTKTMTIRGISLVEGGTVACPSMA